MGLMSEDMECCICLQPYSRREKIPRMLHCKHTFCGLCLQEMTRFQDGLLRVCCPLCRWITCTGSSLTLSGSLWVNTEIWDQIPEREWTDGPTDRPTDQPTTTPTDRPTTTQDKWSPSEHSGLRLKLQNFLRRMTHNVV